MRARMALHASGLAIELREVALRNKPACMLAASPKGSVPVLLFPDGRVIGESWDIMQWALRQRDPENWLGSNEDYLSAAQPWIEINDAHFKLHLDRYKYPDRHPGNVREHYRAQGEIFLQQLEQRLNIHRHLLGAHFSIADAALFPFVRQFAEVDKDWFAHAPYSALRDWLHEIIVSLRFAEIMQKQPPWQPGDAPVTMRVRQGTACRT